MREINCADITNAVKKITTRSAIFLPPDIGIQMECAWDSEESETGRGVIAELVNYFISAASKGTPLCEDIDLFVIFADIGQDVHIVGGNFEDAIKEGVKRGCELFPSLVKKEDNVPTVIHTRIVSGNNLKLTAAPKGSENISAIKMFKQSDKQVIIENFIVETVAKAKSKLSSPWIIGVGIGGTIENCALLAQRALSRPVDVRNPFYEIMERSILDKINKLGIGPRGLGGTTTALAVNLEASAEQIASLPCVVKLGCHFTCRATVEM